MKFNESQQQAITHEKGPALVLAGPGSGKTAVVTNRVKYLIEECKVKPENILVITFTKAAALEMKERFHRLMNVDGIGVTFGTFHGVYFTILRHAYQYRVENIVTEEEQYSILKRIVDRMKLEYDNEKDFLSGILSEISRVKGDLLDLEHYFSVHCGQEVFQQIYRQYDMALKQSRKIDFDDMILYCHELFSQRKDILALWQKKYQYILIDEFQDINKVQYDVVRMLALPQNNLFVVGDDDQSIYGFRGARPEIMLNFTKDYKDSRIITLNVNYRCQENIVKAALHVINHNENRYKKEIRAQISSEEPVHIKEYQDAAEEATEVIEQIRVYQEDGIPYHEMAVLTRTNEGGRYLLEKLLEYNIPFQTRDTIPSLYSHWIAQNIFAYINLALGNRDRNVFMQIMNRPKRYIGRDALSGPIIDFDALRMEYIHDRAWMLERIDRLEEDLHVIANLNPFGAINYIRRAVGYDEFLMEYAEEKDISKDELFDVINEMQEASREFDDYSTWFRHIEQYEEALREKNRQKKSSKEDALNVITMHCAKGLEYEAVFILDANESITPYKKALLVNEIEEERRMFYVAMTRARQHLHISYVKTRFNKELECSRFLQEIRQE